MPRTAPESWRCCDASVVLALNMTSKLQVELPIRDDRPRRLTPLPRQECYASRHIPSNGVGATLAVALEPDVWGTGGMYKLALTEAGLARCQQSRVVSRRKCIPRPW